MILLEKNSPEFIWNFIFVNDGSFDQSEKKLYKICTENTNCTLINLSRNFGHQNAIWAGLNNASSDYIAIIDGDLQDPPEHIPEMIELLKNNYNIVYGKRKKRKGESLLKKLNAYLFYRILNLISKHNIPNDAGDFRVFDKKVLNAFLKCEDHDLYLRGTLAWLGFKSKAFFYNRDKRFADAPKYNFKSMLTLAINALFSQSYIIPKILLFSGISFTILSCIILFYSFFSQTINYDFIKFLTLMLLGSINLLALGTISEYSLRIYIASKNRPNYIIEQKITKKSPEDILESKEIKLDKIS